MSENMFCIGQKVLRNQDGWYRTFRGYPKVNKESWEMIQGFKDTPQKLFLFFIEYVTDDADYAGFLTRDIINEVWNG